MIYLFLILLALNSISIDDAIDQALESIRDAEDVGADTSMLVNRLNYAIKDRDCKECEDDVKAILASIVDEAKELREEAISNNRINAILAYGIYAPISTFLISLFGLYIYDIWSAYETRRFMNMRVKEKD